MINKFSNDDKQINFFKKYHDNLREKPLEVCNWIKKDKKLV